MRDKKSHESRFTDHFLLLTRDLFLSDCHAARTFARTRVGVRALSPNGKSSAMTQSTVAADVHQAFDVHLNLLAQISFDAALLIDDCANAVYFLFRQLANAFIDTDPGLSQDFIRAGAPDAVNVCETDLSSFVSREVHPCDTCHSSSAGAGLNPRCYPCRCLCFGLVQITLTTPLR